VWGLSLALGLALTAWVGWAADGGSDDACVSVSLSAVDAETGVPLLATATATLVNDPQTSRHVAFLGYGVLKLTTPGQYRLVASSSGYEDAAATLEAPACGANLRVGLRFRRAEAEVEFLVKDVRTGIGLDGASLTLEYYGRDQPSLPQVPVMTTNLVTDSVGHRLAWLPSGYYTVLVQRAGFEDLRIGEPREWLGKNVAEVALVSFQYTLDVTLRGHDPAVPGEGECNGAGGADDRPLEDGIVEVEVWSFVRGADGAPLAQRDLLCVSAIAETTDDQGVAKFRNLPPGLWRITCKKVGYTSTDEYLLVWPGPAVGLPPAQTHLARLDIHDTRLRVRLRSAQYAGPGLLEGATVRIDQVTTHADAKRNRMIHRCAKAQPDGEGVVVEFGRLLPGTYQMAVTHSRLVEVAVPPPCPGGHECGPKDFTVQFVPIEQAVSLGDGYTVEEEHWLLARPARVRVMVLEEAAINTHDGRPVTYVASRDRYVELTESVFKPLLATNDVSTGDWTDRAGQTWLEVLPAVYGARLPEVHDLTGAGAVLNGAAIPWPYAGEVTDLKAFAPASPISFSSAEDYELELRLHFKRVDLIGQIVADANDPIQTRFIAPSITRYEPDSLITVVLDALQVEQTPGQVAAGLPPFHYTPILNPDMPNLWFVPGLPPGRHRLTASHPRNSYNPLEVVVPDYADPGMGPSPAADRLVAGLMQVKFDPFFARYDSPGPLPKFQYWIEYLDCDSEGNCVVRTMGPFDESPQFVQPTWTSHHYLTGWSGLAPAGGDATYWIWHGDHVHRGVAGTGGLAGEYTIRLDGSHTDTLPESDLYVPPPVKGTIYVRADIGATNRAELRHPQFVGPIADHLKFTTDPESAASQVTYDPGSGRFTLPGVKSFSLTIEDPLYRLVETWDRGYLDSESAYVIDYGVRVGMNLAGVVRDPNGTPLEGVVIRLELEHGSAAGGVNTVTDAAGTVQKLSSALESQSLTATFLLPGYKAKLLRLDPLASPGRIHEEEIDLGGGVKERQQMFDLSTTLEPLAQPALADFALDRGGLIMKGLTYRSLGAVFVQPVGPDPVKATVAVNLRVAKAGYASLPTDPPETSLDPATDEVLAAYVIDRRHLAVLAELLDPDKGKLYADWTNRYATLQADLSSASPQFPPTGAALELKLQSWAAPETPVKVRGRQALFRAVEQLNPPPLGILNEPNAQALPPSVWAVALGPVAAQPDGTETQSGVAEVNLADLGVGALELAVVGRTRSGQAFVAFPGAAPPELPPPVVVRPSLFVQKLFDLAMCVPVTTDRLWDRARERLSKSIVEADEAGKQRDAAALAVAEQRAGIEAERLERVGTELDYARVQKEVAELDAELQGLRHRLGQNQQALHAEELRVRTLIAAKRQAALDALEDDSEYLAKRTSRRQARITLDRARDSYNSAQDDLARARTVRDNLDRKVNEVGRQIKDTQGRLDQLSPEEEQLRTALRRKLDGEQGADQALAGLRQRYAAKDATFREKLNKLVGLAEKAPIFKLDPAISLVANRYPRYGVTAELGVAYGMANNEPNTRSGSLGFIGSAVRARVSYEAETELEEHEPMGKQALSALGQFDVSFHQAKNEAGAQGFWRLKGPGPVEIEPSLEASLVAQDIQLFDFQPPYEAPSEMRVTVRSSVLGKLDIRVKLLSLVGSAAGGGILGTLLDIVLKDTVRVDARAVPGLKGSLVSELVWDFPKAPPSDQTQALRQNHRQGFGIAGHFPTDGDPTNSLKFELGVPFLLGLQVRLLAAEGEAGIRSGGLEPQDTHPPPEAIISIDPPGPWKFRGMIEAYARFALDLWFAKWEKQFVSAPLYFGSDTGSAGYLWLSRISHLSSEAGVMQEPLSDRWKGGQELLAQPTSGRTPAATAGGYLAILDAAPGQSLPGGARIYLTGRGGSSYGTPLEVPGSEGAFHVALAETSAGEVVVVWAAITSPPADVFPSAALRYAVYHPADLQHPSRAGTIAAGDHLYHSPQLVCGETVDCYFLDGVSGVPGSDWSALLATRLTAGVWTQPETLTGPRSIVRHAAVPARAGQRLVAWVSEAGALWSQVQTGGAGGAWTQPERVLELASPNLIGARLGPALAALELGPGRAAVVYRAGVGEFDAASLYLKPYDFSRGWQAPTRIADLQGLTGEVTAGALAGDGGQGAVLAWTDAGQTSDQSLWLASLTPDGGFIKEPAEAWPARSERFKHLALLIPRGTPWSYALADATDPVLQTTAFVSLPFVVGLAVSTVQVLPSGEVELRWESLGAEYSYTIEYRRALGEGTWQTLAPVSDTRFRLPMSPDPTGFLRIVARPN
jgi:hypothetical protein